jgi:hypothetical protein
MHFFPLTWMQVPYNRSWIGDRVDPDNVMRKAPSGANAEHFAEPERAISFAGS